MRNKLVTSGVLSIAALAVTVAFQNCSPASVRFGSGSQSSVASSSTEAIDPGPAGPASTVAWAPGAWSNCSVACGTGVQSRSIACTGNAGQTLSDQSCQNVPKPSATQTCTLPTSGACSSNGQTGTRSCSATGQVTCAIPASTANWVSGAWGACSATCGGGTQTRANTCVSTSTGQAVGTAACSSPAPAATQACNTQPCAVQPCSNSLTPHQQCAKADGTPQDASAGSFVFLPFATYAQCKATCIQAGNLCINVVLDPSAGAPTDASFMSCTCEPLSRTVSTDRQDGMVNWATILCPGS